MEIIKKVDDIKKLKENKVLGSIPQMEQSVIQFKGKDNILYCEEGVVLKDTNLKFLGSNSVIYLSASKYSYIMNVKLHHDSVFYMGANNYINDAYGKLVVILSEQKHCFIGDSGIISFGVCIRNSDPHLIYDCNTLERINPTQSVFIGDHVWLGQDVLILKGTEIDSGCIIGGDSVISGKKILHNTSWAGNPCRLIREDVFWDKSCVHTWTSKRTKASMNYEDYVDEYLPDGNVDDWIYKPDRHSMPFEELDEKLSVKGSDKKLKAILKLNDKKTKNRFAH